MKEWKGALEKGHTWWDLLFKEITPIAGGPRNGWEQRRQGFPGWGAVGEGAEKKPSTPTKYTPRHGKDGLWDSSGSNAPFAILSQT